VSASARADWRCGWRSSWESGKRSVGSAFPAFLDQDRRVAPAGGVFRPGGRGQVASCGGTFQTCPHRSAADATRWRTSSSSFLQGVIRTPGHLALEVICSANRDRVVRAVGCHAPAPAQQTPPARTCLTARDRKQGMTRSASRPATDPVGRNRSLCFQCFDWETPTE
jgi:hypothetical protein